MKRYYRTRRKSARDQGELNITAFMNLMVILVPFLLITAVFSRITILDLNLPSSNANKNKPIKELQLEVTIRSDVIEIGDRNIGVLNRLKKKNGEYNLVALAKVIRQIKSNFPKKTDISILAEADTEYDILVQVMDRVRMTEVMRQGERVKVELFPNISIGDAPMLAVQEEATKP